MALFISLAACGGWPVLPETARQSQGGTWPELLPMSEIMESSASSDISDDDARQLVARADALRRRASILRAPVPDGAAFEALRQRMAG